MRTFNAERQLHRIEEAFGGAMTRLTEFRRFPACGIGNQGWTTNQACSALSADGSKQAPAFTRGVVDILENILHLTGNILPAKLEYRGACCQAHTFK